MLAMVLISLVNTGIYLIFMYLAFIVLGCAAGIEVACALCDF